MTTSNSELCQANVLMVFVHHFLSAEDEWAIVYNFFAATIVDNLYDRHGVEVGPVFFLTQNCLDFWILTWFQRKDTLQLLWTKVIVLGRYIMDLGTIAMIKRLINYFRTLLKELYLASTLFSDKASHKNKHPFKIWFSNDI